MKTLSISLLGLALSSAYAITPTSDLQSTVTVQRSNVALTGLQKKRAREEVAFNFENTHALLENSRNSKAPITLTLPLGNNEITEITVQGKTNHVGQIVWKNGRFVPVEQPYLSFEGTTKAGERVRGFISEQSFSAIVHSAKNGLIQVQSKSLEIVHDPSSTVQETSFEESDMVASTKTLFSPLQTPQFQSRVDAAGHVQLRHVGLLFTLTDNTFHAIDPTGDISQWNTNPIIRDWTTNFSMQINETLISQLGVTIDAIGSAPELDGVRYIVQPKGGYPGQPANSIFGNSPTVPNTRLGWADANHEFQSWIILNSAPSEQLIFWWDMGIALGFHDPLNSTDPSSSLAKVKGLCDVNDKATAYSAGHGTFFGSLLHLSDTIHEIGHLLGATHTFSSQHGSCNGNMNMETAVEPGSGSTLMSYDGYCAPDDIDGAGDFYFHGKSIEQINTFLTNLETTTTCISHAPTQNRLPTLNVSNQPNANIIPRGVRFELKANLTDLELDDQMAQDPNSVNLQTKLNGAGQVNWEQMDLLGTVPGPLYRSIPPQNANSPANFQPFDYRKGYVRSFPQESTPLGTQWDPLINMPGTLHFRATAWDYNANANAGFPGFVSADVPVNVWDSQKPVFTFPSINQTVKTFIPYNTSYIVTWVPNFAASQTKFAAITLAYKDPWFGWKPLATQENAPGTLNSFSNIQFPHLLGASYTTTLRLEYKTLGDVTWFVESPEFPVQGETIFRTGFE